MLNLIAGEHVKLTFTLLDNGVLKTIPTNSTVRLAIRQGSTLVGGPYPCQSDDPDADWPNGVVTCIIATEDTQEWTKKQCCSVEIAMEGPNLDADKWISPIIINIVDSVIT